MNKVMKGLFMALFVASMCACSSDEATVSPQVENSLVEFCFFDSKLEEFQTTTHSDGQSHLSSSHADGQRHLSSSLANGQRMKAPTRADDVSSSTWKNYFDRLDVAIFPKNANASPSVYRFHQQSTDGGFGSLSVRLPVGSYTLVAVASNKVGKEVDIQSPILATFPNSTVTDMAYVCQSFDVKNGTNSTNCSLSRALTKFVVKSSDCVPMESFTFDYKYVGYFNSSFNPSTGFGIKPETENTISKTATMAIPSSTDKHIDLGFLTFIPQEKQNIRFELKITNSEKQVIRNLVFDNVTLQQNHVTTYTGPFFTSGSSFEFTFDNQALSASDYDSTFGDDGNLLTK